MNLLRAISNLFRFDRTNWKALALSLLAATVFWIFSALNKSHTTNIRLPIDFEYDKSKFVAVDPLPATFTLNVQGNGWDLLRKSLGFKTSALTYPLDRPADTRKIVGSSLSPLVAELIGPMQVNYVVTDTLRIHIEPKISRRLKMVADLSRVTYKENFGRTSPVVITPDSVTLEGPRSMMEKLPDTLILFTKFSKVSGDFNQRVEISVFENRLISRNPPMANVSFSVKPVLNISRKFRLVLPKAAANAEVDEDSIQVSFLIPQEFKDQFDAEPITSALPADIAQVRKGEKKSFMPLLQGVPAYAQITAIDSVTVKKN